MMETMMQAIDDLSFEVAELNREERSHVMVTAYSELRPLLATLTAEERERLYARMIEIVTR